jgi:cellulose synthase (UDP-forming)
MQAATGSQFGSDCENSPVSQHDPNDLVRREILRSRLLLYSGIAASIMAAAGLGRVVLFRIRLWPLLAIADGFFAINIAFLMYGSLFYQVTRLAFYKRLRNHRPTERQALEAIYDAKRTPPLLILIPSYREELRVVRQTLMSAALTEYPDRRVVLLIDDPPDSSNPEDEGHLAATRELVSEVGSMLGEQQRRYALELTGFEHRSRRGSLANATEGRRLAKLYRRVARWLQNQAALTSIENHYDRLFVDRILLEPADAHLKRARELEELSSEPSGLTFSRLRREYRRLAALFSVPFTSFERKRFINLSHAPNKAMNLNSYLGLLGKQFREVRCADGLFLEECDSESSGLRVPAAEYVITLDADSLLLSDYALRLTHVMRQPAAGRFAVVESPYTAVPGSPRLLERLAGAQTDVQWIGSQGATFYNASFWVGANALLRWSALEDICETIDERGYPLRRYIQDRTLVEDTESSIDLIARGWQIYCYPERLSYSATPPDFGALVIQRRRWANGPLLIVPKLLKYALSGSRRVKRLPESIFRLYTLTSAMGALSMLMMIAVRLPDASLQPIVWLGLSAVPYYILYCRDLIGCGYDWWDLPRMYGLNLLLIPINLAGLLKSLYQGMTGRQSAFVRTPKVPDRTAAPAVHVLIPTLIFICIVASTAKAMAAGGWAYGVFGIINAFSLGYAILWYVGIEGWRDVASVIFGRWGAARATHEYELPAQDIGRVEPESALAQN